MEFQMKYFLNRILFMDFFKTVLYLAVEKENSDIVKLLLMNDNLDINFLYVFLD